MRPSARKICLFPHGRRASNQTTARPSPQASPPIKANYRRSVRLQPRRQGGCDVFVGDRDLALIGFGRFRFRVGRSRRALEFAQRSAQIDTSAVGRPSSDHQRRG